VTQPGIVFGVNDSRNRPQIFAFDSSGRERGRWTLLRAGNDDWEAASTGPCSPAESEPRCLYIGDVGDNSAVRPALTVYRVREPTADSAVDARLPVEWTNFVLPDQPQDIEAMYVPSDSVIYFITKRPRRNPAGQLRSALIYRVRTAWMRPQAEIARLVDSLPIVPGSAGGRQVTDAALSRDHRLLAVRTYREVLIFTMNPETGLPVSGAAPTSCSIVGLGERQGEGIGWWWDGRRLLLTSEGRNAPLHVIECLLPGHS
jgi:hypothetical protein